MRGAYMSASGALPCAGLLVLTLITGCGEVPKTPLTPATDPPAPASATLSGTIWIHGPGGVRPNREGAYFGWIETGTSGYTTGRRTADAAGHYSLNVPGATRVRLLGVGMHQPCAVTVRVTGSVVRDVHLVEDPAQLGARLPAELASQIPVITGIVYETTPGGRIPLGGVRVETDGLMGLGLVTATTLTDDEGRFVLCGQDGDLVTYLFAGKTGYTLAEVGTVSINGLPLSIELFRSVSAQDR